MRILSFLLLLLVTSGAPHPLYVSITEMEYNSDKKRLEVSLKMFQDDFLNGMKTNGWDMQEACSALKTDEERVQAYLRENFEVVVDEKALKIDYLGTQCEDNDLVYLFFSLPLKKSPREVSITNTVLFEAIGGQENIVHIKVDGKKKSLLLNASRPHMQALLE